MTSIDFYFNAAERLQVACRLAAKALALFTAFEKGVYDAIV